MGRRQVRIPPPYKKQYGEGAKRVSFVTRDGKNVHFVANNSLKRRKRLRYSRRNNQIGGFISPILKLLKL